MTVTKELLRRLPKAELHVHLDGCLRPQTMIELARDAGVRLPETTADALARYLERYEFTLAVMQSAASIERVAYEFVVDVAAENVRYVEARYCPVLHTSNLKLGEVVEATLEGLKRGEAESGTRASLIVCGLRTFSPFVSDDLARVAVDYRNDGVVAFDLAGSEKGHPARDHARAFSYAASHGLHCTCHAGEGDGPESVRQALHDCCAHRIGHGTRITESAEVEEYVVEHQIPLEVCLTSNVHTQTIDDVAKHPVRRYFDIGCAVTLNTDGRLMDGVSLTDEFWLAHRKLGFSRTEIDRLIMNAFQSAFLPENEKALLLAQVQRELEEVQ